MLSVMTATQNALAAPRSERDVDAGMCGSLLSSWLTWVAKQSRSLTFLSIVTADLALDPHLLVALLDLVTCCRRSPRLCSRTLRWSALCAKTQNVVVVIGTYNFRLVA